MLYTCMSSLKKQKKKDATYIEYLVIQSVFLAPHAVLVKMTWNEMNLPDGITYIYEYQNRMNFKIYLL